MEWLEATLAFAVVMMIFATFVSAIIEVLHRITRIREDGLESMMIQIYRKIIKNESDDDQSHEPDPAQSKFVTSMTQTRLLPLAPNAKLLRKFVYKTVNAQRLMSLPTEQFIQRFMETDEGKQFINEAATQGRDYAEEALKGVAEQYKEFGDSATDFFTRRSRLLSSTVAILLAISVNLDAFSLFNAFLSDKGVRQAMIERGNEVSDELHRVEEMLRLARSGQAGDDVDNLELITGKIENLQSSFKSLSATGIPIGWDRAPWERSSFQDTDSSILKTVIIIAWIFSVLLGGILVGLGGPFWYDIFRKLGSLTGITVGSQQDKKKSSPPQNAQT